MQLRQNVDYGYLQGTFPTKTKRFENLGALSLSPLYFWQKPLLNTLRGVFLVLTSEKMHRTSFRRRNGLAGKTARRKSLHRTLD